MRSTGGTSSSRRDGTALAFTPWQPVPGVRQRALSRSATRPILSHNKMKNAARIAHAKAERNKKPQGILTNARGPLLSFPWVYAVRVLKYFTRCVKENNNHRGERRGIFRALKLQSPPEKSHFHAVFLVDIVVKPFRVGAGG